MPDPERVQVATEAARIDRPAEPRPTSGKRSRTRPRTIRVVAVRRPEPDIDKLARFLIRLAEEDAMLPEGERLLDRGAGGDR